MIYIKKQGQWLLLLLLLSTGCRKYLSVMPDNRIDVSSVTYEKVAQLLTTAYPDKNYMQFCETMSDNVGDKGIPNRGNLENVNAFFFNDYPTRDDDTPIAYWYSCYSAIAAANQALAMINTLPDSLPKDYRLLKGEALLARAYSHFMLVTLFAKTYDSLSATTEMGIPYVLQSEKTDLPKYDRKTVAYTYNMIEADMLAGIALLNGRNYFSDKMVGDKDFIKFHFTPAAAQAFASRFYLFKKDYRQVIAHTNKLFENDADPSSFLRPWKMLEALPTLEFPNQFAQPTLKCNLLVVETSSGWGLGGNISSYLYGISSQIQRLFADSANVTGKKLLPQIYGQPGSYSTLKFIVNQTPIGQGGALINNNVLIPLFTADEALLNRAEAFAQTGDYNNAVRDLGYYVDAITGTKSGLYLSLATITDFYKNVTSSPKEALLLGILDLKRRGFLQEGMRWFDILRYKLPVTHKGGTDQRLVTIGADDPRRILQLPEQVALAGISLNKR